MISELSDQLENQKQQSEQSQTVPERQLEEGDTFM